MYYYNPNKVTAYCLRYIFYIIYLSAISLLLFTILLNSWIGDDAMIMFRQVWNLLSGVGITFNFGQRVQAFSHPLWFWVVALFGFITRELFLTTTLISVVFTLSSTLILVKTEYVLNERRLVWITPIVFLPFSWAFIDYSTSGLENALSYFLVSMLLYLLARVNAKDNLKTIFFILSLLLLNRLDYAVLFLPLALYLIWQSGSIQQFYQGIWPGALLIICWFIFATYYFGFPLPNTYYAKLNAGYPTDEVLSRGWDYLISMKSDLVSIIIIIAATFLSLISRNKILIALTFGQLLYIGYIYQAGGDFMLGRFFAILVFLSIGQIILFLGIFKKWNLMTKNYLILTILILVIFIGLFQRYPFLLSKDSYESRGPYFGVDYTDFHIVDEKMFYYQKYGLFSPTRNSWPVIKSQSELRPSKYKLTCGGIGLFSILVQSHYIIDQCALTDPFISRIPALQTDIWRIGHHYRKTPTEYGEYITGNVKEIIDQDLNPYLKDITLVSTGDLADIKRLSAIWRVNSGYYSDTDFSKYISKEIWVPRTLKEKIFQIDNWENGLRDVFFNGKLTIQSNEKLLANALSITTDLGFEYEIFVNDILVKNFIQKNEAKPANVEFPEPVLVHSVKLNAINYTANNLPENRIFELNLHK